MRYRNTAVKPDSNTSGRPGQSAARLNEKASGGGDDGEDREAGILFRRVGARPPAAGIAY
jgi:hypothetical protein